MMNYLTDSATPRFADPDVSPLMDSLSRVTHLSPGDALDSTSAQDGNLQVMPTCLLAEYCMVFPPLHRHASLLVATLLT